VVITVAVVLIGLAVVVLVASLLSLADRLRSLRRAVHRALLWAEQAQRLTPRLEALQVTADNLRATMGPPAGQ
jgi:hypothetical protein